MKPQNKNYIKIAHLSDLHFGRIWGARPDRVGACQRSLAKFKPDVVLVTGDLALFGSRREFLLARDFLDSLPYEKVVVPGNHDVLDGMFLPKMNPWKRLRMFNRYLPYERDMKIGDLEIIGMDSTSFFTIGRGKIRIEEFERFTNSKAKIKCMALHHHVIAIPETGEFNMLSNVDKVIGEIIKHNIQYVFHGHRHRYMHFRLDSFIWDRKLDTPVDIFASGTTLAKRTRGHDPYNNYNQVTIRTDVKHNEFTFLNMRFDDKKKEFVKRNRGFKTKSQKQFQMDGFNKKS